MSINFQATNNQIKRVKDNWSEIADEDIKIEQIGSAIYGFGSELAVLRLYRKFNGCGRAEYSKNLATWFFTTEK